MKEFYPLRCIGKIFFIFLGLGFYWSVHDLPSGGVGALPLSLPFFILGVSGLLDAFSRIHHTFYPGQQKVAVDQSGFWKKQYGYRYTDLRLGVECRGGRGGPYYCTILHYPDATVCLTEYQDYETAQTTFAQLMQKLSIPESQRNPSVPKVRTWF